MFTIPKGTLSNAVLFSLVVLPATVIAQNSLVTPEIVEKVSKSVVLIKGTNDKGSQLGSGFLLSSDGKVATNLHVIREMKTGGVQLQSGEIFDAFSILAFDERKDLAILQIAGFDLPAIELGNSNEVKAGESVIAVGSPRGLQGTVTAGVVSAIRDDPASAGYKVIQTDAAANPGNSGGPLLNGRGQVIGVVTTKLRDSEGLNFAVPINYVRGLMASTGKPVNLDGLRAALKALPSDSFKETSSFPPVWKSMTSGSKFKIRTQSDIVYVERLLPEGVARAGVFSGYELRKSGSGYGGSAKIIGPCTYNADDWATLGRKTVTNRCTFENPVEFSLFSDSRIEGRINMPPDDAKFNCKKCTYSKPPVWQRFVWIPE
jgi:S1-C subfamily serine protease